MPYHVTVVYPNDDDAKFDMDYYLKTHMPLVQENWGKHGLKHWQIVKYDAQTDGSKSPYSVGAFLTFENADQVKAAVSSPEAAVVFGDVPKFSNKSPLFLPAGVMGSS